MRDPALSEQTNCVLVADDLTGACDSAVQFAARGIRSVVFLDAVVSASSTARIKAFSTDTRDASEAAMKAQIESVATTVSVSHSQLVFKKIDSLMRGSPGAEISAAMRAFDCDIAIITPAFPDMGRTVRDGRLEVSGHDGWEPFQIAARLRAQGLPECVHLTPGELTRAIREGKRYLSLDITTNRDLEELVGEALDSDRRVLWAGSGGLAAALAGVLFPGGAHHEAQRPGKLPVLFCIGSDHPVTAAQLLALRHERRTADFDADSTQAPDIEGALDRGYHTIVRISRTQFAGNRLKDLLQGAPARAAAVLLSGGDTASAVCRAVGVKEIEIEDQIVTGLPWGFLRGGSFDGVRSATKSGAFGREDALIRVTDFFTCQKI